MTGPAAEQELPRPDEVRELARDSTLVTPANNQPANVKKIMMGPGGTNGQLCLCNGEVTGEIGDVLQAVYFTNAKGKDVAIDPTSVLSSAYSKPIQQSLNAPITWSHNQQIPAWQKPTAADNEWNTLRVTAAIYRPIGMGMMQLVNPPPSASHNYKGVGVDACTAAIAANGGADGKGLAISSTSSPTPNDRDPFDQVRHPRTPACQHDTGDPCSQRPKQ